MTLFEFRSGLSWVDEWCVMMPSSVAIKRVKCCNFKGICQGTEWTQLNWSELNTVCQCSSVYFCRFAHAFAQWHYTRRGSSMFTLWTVTDWPWPVWLHPCSVFWDRAWRRLGRSTADASDNWCNIRRSQTVQRHAASTTAASENNRPSIHTDSATESNDLQSTVYDCSS